MSICVCLVVCTSCVCLGGGAYGMDVRCVCSVCGMDVMCKRCVCVDAYVVSDVYVCVAVCAVYVV